MDVMSASSNYLNMVEGFNCCFILFLLITSKMEITRIVNKIIYNKIKKQYNN